MFQKEEEKSSASQVLMEVANTLPLFHDQNGEAYAFINGECVALRSQMLKTWLTYTIQRECTNHHLPIMRLNAAKTRLPKTGNTLKQLHHLHYLHLHKDNHLRVGAIVLSPFFSFRRHAANQIRRWKEMAVYKRGDKGVFYMNFTVNGVRVFRSTGKFTKKEAKQYEAIEKQKLLDEEKMTPQEKAAKTLLLSAVETVYDVQWKHGKDADRSYARAKNVAAIIGNVKLGSINEDMVLRLVQALDKKEAEAGTINRYLATLKTLLRHFKQPTDHIKLRKERKGRIRTVNRDEENKIIDLLRNTKHNKRRQFYYEVADLVEVLVDSGLRLGEALALDYETINFETNLMTIWFNKGDRPRSIPMTSRVRSVLERRKSNGSKPFNLKPYQAENAWRWVRKEMKLEHDEQFVLHCLRHTTCSRLLNKGIDVITIKEWMGHADIKTTMIYMHLDPNKLAHAATVLEL